MSYETASHLGNKSSLQTGSRVVVLLIICTIKVPFPPATTYVWIQT